jgi:hypothetical protein
MRGVGIFAAAVVGLFVVKAAVGQTIYEPVRYQYGQYGEVFYGGTNPALTSNDYVYLPERLRGVYRARRFAAPIYPYPSPYTPYGAGTRFVSPRTNSMTITYPEDRPLVFTDAIPYEDVGQFGYTADDARNEAYSNVPRIQYGGGPRAEKAAEAAAPAAEHAPAAAADPRLKAIPLLNWAKAERERNPALFAALLKEARKYDASAAEAVEKGGK